MMPFEQELLQEQCVSIIVPIYNSERYLSACIESILNQTHRNLEIILVDDGSTDCSGKICDEYQKRDQRIKVIHKENGGNTSARRVGLKAASSVYAGFVDSDDWIDRDMYEMLLGAALAENADFVTSGIVFEYEGYSKRCRDGVCPGVYREGQMALLRNNMIHVPGQEDSGIIGTFCTRLFKKKHLLPILNEMDDAVQLAEDIVGSYVYLCRIKCAVVLEQAFYHYRQYSGSLTHARDEWYLSKVNLAHKFFCQKAQQEHYPASLRSKFDQHFLEIILQAAKHFLGYDENIPCYAFPFHCLPANSRLILYGAGVVGKSYYNLIQWTDAFQIVGWIDRDYRRLGLKNISGTEILKERAYDYIIIAVQNTEAAMQIREDLIGLWVPAEKIRWFEPKHLFKSIFSEK